MCRTYGARPVLALTQPFRAGLKFGSGPTGLQNVEKLISKREFDKCAGR
jgi:hypothetical protein